MLNYTGPECVPWDWEEEFLREPPRPPVAKMTEKEIYDNPDRWEEAIKQDVNLFPHEGTGCPQSTLPAPRCSLSSAQTCFRTRVSN